MKNEQSINETNPASKKKPWLVFVSMEILIGFCLRNGLDQTVFNVPSRIESFGIG